MVLLIGSSDLTRTLKFQAFPQAPLNLAKSRDFRLPGDRPLQKLLLPWVGLSQVGERGHKYNFEAVP